MKAAESRHGEESLDLVDFHSGFLAPLPVPALSLGSRQPDNILLSEVAIVITIYYQDDSNIPFDRREETAHNQPPWSAEPSRFRGPEEAGRCARLLLQRGNSLPRRS